MPTVEFNFALQATTPEGKQVSLSPRTRLQLMVACIGVIISPPNTKSAPATGKDLLPESVDGLALIDTGAATTAVDESVCQKLGLAPTGEMLMGHAGGAEKRLCYPLPFNGFCTLQRALPCPRLQPVG